MQISKAGTARRPARPAPARCGARTHALPESPMKRMEFRDRWVLVTGASSGLGREMAKILATKYGAHLIVSARRQDRLESLKAEIAELCSVKVITVCADLARLEDIDRLLAEAARQPLYA